MATVIDLTGNTVKASGFDGPISNSDVSGLDALGGTLTGTTDGDLADVADVTTSGGNTYSDATLNGVIADINTQLKELQTAYNALLSALQGN